jgi:hypothetical protein
MAPRNVTITLSGDFDQSGAKLDRQSLGLLGAHSDLSATIKLDDGMHRLLWAVTGPPGAAYAVSIAGISKPWSRDDLTIGKDSQDEGSRDFEVP